MVFWTVFQSMESLWKYTGGVTRKLNSTVTGWVNLGDGIPTCIDVFLGLPRSL